MEAAKAVITIVRLLCVGITPIESKIQCIHFYSNCLINHEREIDREDKCKQQFKSGVKYE